MSSDKLKIPKVTIKDSDFLKGITIGKLKKYLTAKKWEKIADTYNTLPSGERKIIAEQWSPDIGLTKRNAVLIPNSETYIDYVARTIETIFTLERYESRSQLEIIVDIMQQELVVSPNLNLSDSVN